jgi:hypothetical protein
MPVTFSHHSLGLVCLRMANTSVVVDATSFPYFVHFITVEFKGYKYCQLRMSVAVF